MFSRKIVATAVLTCLSAGANAALFHFTGSIANHNDVITTTFTLDKDATNVRVWTDSFLSATNFDPITALWNATTGQLIKQNDDDPSIDPQTQTWFDSGFSLASLSAGTYYFTVGTFNNWAAGTNISQGFSFDNQAPIPLSDWCQPSSHCNMGTTWSVWLDGVSSASVPDDPTPAVPEPSSLALLGLGLAGFAMSRRKRQ